MIATICKVQFPKPSVSKVPIFKLKRRSQVLRSGNA
jgi:hypothetical protein